MREVVSNVRAGNTIFSQSTLIINRPNKTSINKPQSSCSLSVKWSELIFLDYFIQHLQNAQSFYVYIKYFLEYIIQYITIGSISFTCVAKHKFFL